MKKIVYSMLLLCLASSSFAKTMGMGYLDSTGCYPDGSSGNLTACLKNNTSANITADYQLMMTTLYKNGTYDESIASLTALAANHYIDISFSSEEIAASHIEARWFTIIKGDASAYRVMPGCMVEITSNAVSKAMLGIYPGADYLFCR